MRRRKKGRKINKKKKVLRANVFHVTKKKKKGKENRKLVLDNTIGRALLDLYTTRFPLAELRKQVLSRYAFDKSVLQ